MKKRILLICCIVSLTAALPATGEILFPAPDDLVKAMDDCSYPSDAYAAKCFKLGREQMDGLAAMPLGKYLNLEAVVLEFNVNPDAPDAAKEELIVSLENKLPALVHLRKCTRLKYLVMHAGEFLFIRTSDCLPYGGDLVLRKKAERLNLERLNRRFGKKVSDILPGVKVYAYTWSW